MAISLFHLIDMVERRWCPATLVEDEDEKEELMEQVSRMVAILIIC